MRALLKNPLVDCDLEEAALWYNQREPSAAEKLIWETERTIRLVAADPLRFRVFFENIRRAKIPNFKHHLYFIVRDDSIRVFALLHGARNLEALLRARRALDYSGED